MLPKTIAAKTLEIKGPRINAPSLAIAGFCKSHNINKEELSEQLFERQMFFIYKKHLPATDIKQLLCDTLPRAIASYSWPKSMYWKDYSLTWVRPLTNILCILDDQALAIKLAHLTANNFTYGHKFIAPNKLENIQSFQDYQQRLEENKVIIDQVKRQKMITDQLQEVVCKYDLVIHQDLKLLEEVTGLIEYPTVMIGKIADKFLTLPPEVLITSMRTHQKYFATTTKSGGFAPYFLFVSNNLSEHQDNIIKGNEKVLSARLADALYFYNQDLQQSQAKKRH
jgi:glycyl-tRNA synthetase beta chain